MNLYTVKIKVEYHCEERWIEQKLFNTCELQAKYQCIYNLNKVFTDDDGALIDEHSAIVQRLV